MEIEADKAVSLRQLELTSQKDAHVPSAPSGMFPSSTLPTHSEFDVSKHITFGPPFREAEVDSYFGTFERIASALHWPPEAWALLLQWLRKLLLLFLWRKYLLTMMCAATRFPEAIPLRKITTNSIVKALIKFFSTFGLPRVTKV